MKFTDHFRFNGIATRSQYWATNLIAIAACVVVFLFGVFIAAMGEVYTIMMLPGILLYVGSIVAYIWVLLAVTVKRCRDADLNPFWTAAIFIPYVGWVIMIIIGALPTVEKKAELA